MTGALRSNSPYPRLALTGCALAALAFVGHAADGDGLRGALRLALMATHLLAVGAWLGALAPLVAAVASTPADGAAQLKRFGDFGLLAVLVVVGTGLCSLAFVVAQAHAAIGPTYLKTLGVKLAFVVALLAAAAVNRWLVTPRFATDPARGFAWLRITTAIEQALGLAVVASVALLGQLDPGM